MGQLQRLFLRVFRHDIRVGTDKARAALFGRVHTADEQLSLDDAAALLHLRKTLTGADPGDHAVARSLDVRRLQALYLRLFVLLAHLHASRAALNVHAHPAERIEPAQAGAFGLLHVQRRFWNALHNTVLRKDVADRLFADVVCADDLIRPEKL